MDVTIVTMTHLPGRAAVVMSQKGESLFIYLSHEYDLDTLAEALEEASNARLALAEVAR